MRTMDKPGVESALQATRRESNQPSNSMKFGAGNRRAHSSVDGPNPLADSPAHQQRQKMSYVIANGRWFDGTSAPSAVQISVCTRWPCRHGRRRTTRHDGRRCQRCDESVGGDSRHHRHPHSFPAGRSQRQETDACGVAIAVMTGAATKVPARTDSGHSSSPVGMASIPLFV